MITRKMNERITFYEIDFSKDKNGDAIEIEKELFSCWAEIAKATTKEFRDKSTEKIESIKKRKNIFVFYVRHQQEQSIESEMLLKWRNLIYKVESIEKDYSAKDMDMISVVLVE